MFFGKNPPEIAYLGLPGEFTNKKIPINSYLDLLNQIVNSCKYNISLDIKTVCLDSSEFLISDRFFNNLIEEESSETSNLIEEINSITAKTNIKICFYIGKDYFLGSQLKENKDFTISLINSISNVFDLIGIKYPSIMIRVGSAYGNRKKTMEDFCDTAMSLEKGSFSKICVMNDDKPSLFSVTDLLSGVYYKLGIPICFRSLPHQFNGGGLSIREALFLSSSTWSPGLKPIFIYSESKESDSFGSPLISKTSDYLTRRIPTFGLDIDVVIDSDAKEDVCLKYRMDYKSLPPIVIGKKNF